MPRVTIPAQVAPKHYEFTTLALTPVAADPVNNNQFRMTGREILLARNTSTTTVRNVTVISVADPFGRTGNRGRALAVGELAYVFGPGPLDGWQQSDGNLHVNADSADVQFYLVRLP